MKTLPVLAVALVSSFCLVAPGSVASPAPAADQTCHGRAATMVGTDQHDVLIGTEGPDVILGLGGNDRIEGRGGDDVICAGLDGLRERTTNGGVEYVLAIGDTVTGGPGDDLIDLGWDQRQLTGYDFAYDTLNLGRGATGVTLRLAEDGATGTADGDGHDRIVGQPRLEVVGSQGPDRIWGTSSGDVIDGRGGDDVVHGLAGNDELSDSGASGDRDRLVGGPGRDRLHVVSGPDVLRGGAGPDLVDALDAGVVLDGGPGDDHLFFGGVGAGCADLIGGGGRDALGLRPAAGDLHRTIDIDLGAGTFGPCRGSVGGFEELGLDGPLARPGATPHWRVRGTPGAERVELAGRGQVVAHLRGGDDELVGGNADDVLDGGPGEDTADGGADVDRCPRVEHRYNCES